ncbi:hypothetical protein C8R43DRAFT_1192454 [Mycena crocata]|nr:hypothetical protein C8R43DRAFT_1192454 [Mycena crocata]
MGKKSTKPSTSKAKKPNVRFTKAEPGKRRSSASDAPGPSRKKARTAGAQGGTTSPQPDPSSGSSAPSANAASVSNADGKADIEPTKRVRVPWGIHPKEVPKEAKPTQRAFQRLIRALCGLLTQNDVLPPAIEQRNHYNQRFNKVHDYRLHMRSLIDQSRTAVAEATERATKLVKDAKALSGPIATDIARIPADHLATVFTMVLKAGLQGFVPDIEGPIQSAYNQLHRHIAVSAFQFLSSSFALMALNVNNGVAQDHNLLSDMYNNFVYGTLAQNTKMERRNLGSLSQSLVNSVAYKARTRRIAYVKEAHSDDEHSSQGRRTRLKPGRSTVAGKFFVEELDVKTEEYRQRNPGRGVQKKADTRKRETPLLRASEISMGLPADVPIDFFTPVFYNSLTVKERARYMDTGVAFPLEKYAFAPEHAAWKFMGKAEFMEKYGKEVLAQYNLPSEEEIPARSDSDADDEGEEEEEIDLADTDSEMEVEEELNA